MTLSPRQAELRSEALRLVGEAYVRCDRAISHTIRDHPRRALRQLRRAAAAIRGAENMLRKLAGGIR